ncbi:hypothetical protein ANO11243_090440 [Dothideomycetidae sp. 11243]|nr:hypothetical protein ANO11243_090440 [fungal sp. No.11243]
MAFHVTDPHPSAKPSKRSTYITSGRGGAGNITRYTTTSVATGATVSPSPLALPPPPNSARMMTGRGGAGNAHRSHSTTSTTMATVAVVPRPVPMPIKPRSSSQSSGSSGASDVAMPGSPTQCAIFSFDEELERDQRMRDNAARTPVYHIGRGGAGNTFYHATAAPTADRRYYGANASSIDSADSAKRRSIANMVERISRTLSRP